MKIKIVVLSILTVALFSCKKNKKNLEEKVVQEKDIKAQSKIIECYEYIKNNNTIKAQLVFNDKNVSGDLNYNLFQKDKNSGTISGTINGDTIFADYTFSSEGTESVRQVAFLRKNKTLIEGYGQSKEINQKLVFKDIKKLSFTSTLILLETTCN